MIPVRLTSPTVGFRPTMPFSDDGQMTDPSVSVPTAAIQKSAATAAPLPELEPHGERSRTCGFFVWPPRPLQPLLECVERKFAHSLRFVFPRITAPEVRSRAATPASLCARFSASTSEPALVLIRSPVSMLSLSRIGMPCNGPKTLPDARSASAASASASASGLISITLFTRGPFASSVRMRVR